MSRLTMDWAGGPAPKRGDLLHFPRSRYMVLGVRKVKRRDPTAGPRYSVTAMQLQKLRDRTIQLFAGHAHRHGGQLTHECQWNPRKKKTMTFEDLMRRGSKP